MTYFNKVKEILDWHREGREELDTETILEMLEAAIDGLENCEREEAAKKMYEAAGYLVR